MKVFCTQKFEINKVNLIFKFCFSVLTASGMAGRLNTTGDTTVSMQEDSDEQQEVIEVQILPQVRKYSQTS